MRMRMLKSFVVAMSFGMLLMVSTARADDWNHLTKITFSGPVQVADTQLAAGTYIFKIMDNMGDRNIVQIYNEDQTHLIATIMAMPDYRLTPTSSTTVKFAETSNGVQAEGNVPASGLPLKEWFYPGDGFGQEFRVKPVSQVAEAQPEPAPEPAPAIKAPAPAAAAAHTRTRAWQTPAPHKLQDSQTAAPAPAPTTDQTATTSDQTSDPSELLPKTASDLPLMGLVGLLSGCCGFTSHHPENDGLGNLRFRSWRSKGRRDNRTNGPFTNVPGRG